ncbi:MAG TPA: hypothetical protein VG944_22000 [Fimbriimonas sp.]|nr:hypothetical protein [Fimbriimonas sp.]
MLTSRNISAAFIGVFVLSTAASAGFLRDGDVHPVTLVVPSSIAPSSNGQVQIQVSPVPAVDTTVYLSSSDSSQLTVPSYVVVPAYHNTATFNASATASASTSAYISAVVGASQVNSPSISL